MTKKKNKKWMLILTIINILLLISSLLCQIRIRQDLKQINSTEAIPYK